LRQCRSERGAGTCTWSNHEQKELELTDLVGQNLEAVVAYQHRTEQELDHHQHVIEAITKNVGRPRFLYLVLLLVVLWIGVQGLLASFGRVGFDPAPFSWLQGLISLSGLLVATMVLITQNRQAKQTEHRRHLDLQVSLLIEQKVTKVIALVEELRRDLPTVQNRVDFQAEAMQEVIDPQTVLGALEDMLQEGSSSEEKEQGLQNEQRTLKEEEHETG
jgi:uncharacterized membrane protein